MSPSETTNAVGSALDLRVTFKVQAFRAFRDEAAFELRPLTLLYGYNQAGKSTLLRLVSLISDSLRPGTPALDLNSPSLRKASFKELGWMGREPDLSPRLKIVASAKSQAPTLSLQYVDDGGLVVNRVQLFRGSGDKFKVSYDGDVRREPERQSARYAGQYRGEEWSGRLTFQSLLPDGVPEEAAEILREIGAALEPLRQVVWLQANRLVDGGDLAAMLREPRFRAVLDEASAWLTRNELGNEIAVHLDGAGNPRLVLGFAGREHLPLHLAGEGVRALLPVVLYACLAELGRRSADTSAPSVLAIEEPETNLHPHLQEALFVRLLDTVRAGVPVVLETHSVYVLRAMQIAVLKGKIDPAQIGLYWIEQKDGAATVTPIEIGEDAAMRGWRPQVFEREQELAHTILDLRWKRMEGR